MKPHDILNHENPQLLLSEILSRLHIEGPTNNEDLEILSYLKFFKNDVFNPIEKKLMYLLGVFYKADAPEDILSLTYSIYSQAIQEETGQLFTPVQASIRNEILKNRFFSFSAPTSAGKSFLFRELIKDQQNDIIIVVPSRALIAEYLIAVQEIVGENKEILVLQFIDDINKAKTSRKIFVVTPERASDIFKYNQKIKPSLFLFDEAQISEEFKRGVSFDALVRRVSKVYPNSKKVFAHPFVENPEAQLTKHSIQNDSLAKVYNQSTVGKIYLGYDKASDTFELFSPFIPDAHLKVNKVLFENDIIKRKLLEGGSILIYITKQSIYDRSFETTFQKYLELCENVTDSEALAIINEVEELIGAKYKDSKMIELMKLGIVIHHGSIPLVVRFLIEKFTNKGFARLCFATSTLVQGVNMPFDVVWIENARFEGTDEDKTLGLKNLIGRAGRSTPQKNSFDYGFIVVKNIKAFIARFNGKSKLSNDSQLDNPSDNIPEDLKEYIDAIKEDDVNDEYNLPNSKTDRLYADDVMKSIKNALDFLYSSGNIIDGNTYRELSSSQKKKLKDSFAEIFEASLGRRILTGERTVLSASITILLWQIQGKTFKELLGLRYSYLTNQKEQAILRRKFKSKEISKLDYEKQIDNIPITYSAIPHSIPDSSLKSVLPSRFARNRVKDFNYDLLVYDTYDFLDKVISFSLSDIFITAFDQYHILTEDIRALEMVNYFKYGTNIDKEIWLFRYGYSIEEIEQILPYVDRIDENEITFSKSIDSINNSKVYELISRFT